MTNTHHRPFQLLRFTFSKQFIYELKGDEEGLLLLLLLHLTVILRNCDSQPGGRPSLEKGAKNCLLLQCSGKKLIEFTLAMG